MLWSFFQKMEFDSKRKKEGNLKVGNIGKNKMECLIPTGDEIFSEYFKILTF